MSNVLYQLLHKMGVFLSKLLHFLSNTVLVNNWDGTHEIVEPYKISTTIIFGTLVVYSIVTSYILYSAARYVVYTKGAQSSSSRL